MLRLLSPVRLATAGAVLLVVFLVVVLTRGSDQFLELPDKAHSLIGVVQVPGHTRHKDDGGIYYVDVIVKKASLLEAQFSFLRPEGAELIPKEAFVPRGLTYNQQLKLESETMKVSQRKASVVALRALGFNVRAHEAGVRVVDVEPDSNAKGALRAQDLIVAADGQPIHSQPDLFHVLARHHVGEVVRIRIRRGSALHNYKIKTIADSQNQKRAIIGVIPFEAVVARLPVHVRFNLQRDVGGPSAGLAFALEVLEQAGRDIDHGLKIAATGEIQLDGSVTRIGAVKQKTIGARQAHVDAFLVPVDGDNAKVAKRYAHGLTIIPVKTFQQALQSLATLGRKA